MQTTSDLPASAEGFGAAVASAIGHEQSTIPSATAARAKKRRQHAGYPRRSPIASSSADFHAPLKRATSEARPTTTARWRGSRSLRLILPRTEKNTKRLGNNTGMNKGKSCHLSQSNTAMSGMKFRRVGENFGNSNHKGKL